LEKRARRRFRLALSAPAPSHPRPSWRVVEKGFYRAVPAGSGSSRCFRAATASRAGDTEAHFALNYDHQTLCRGRHQGVRPGRRRCVSALPRDFVQMTTE
jgi:hypothetical protein